jgi:hypothetical protein
VRQWVISVPKRLRCFLADRPAAVRELTKIFRAEGEKGTQLFSSETEKSCVPFSKS